jgi:hypothetical protein
MGLKLGDISPLAGMITGKGAMGDLMASGLGGVLGSTIARNAQKKDEAEERAQAEARAQDEMAAAKMKAARGMKKGGAVKKMAAGGSVSSASKRGDGCAQRGKTRA